MNGTSSRSHPSRQATPTLAEKVAYLSRVESYAEGATAVEIVETHRSYVFLTDRYAYKLKKPVRYPFLDFSTLEARRFNCEEEVRLNRRLARNVYLGVIPLALTSNGLRLEEEGEAVEWLVKMRRLPRHLMLDRALQEGWVTERDIVRFTRVLCAFYRDAERIPLTAAAYRERLRRAFLENHEALSEPEYGLNGTVLDAIRTSQLAFLDGHTAELDARVHLIVEGHGDLRPQHVCLAAEPLFIDCLEFNRELRIVDPADELGYLAMECELLGTGYVGDIVFETYHASSGDAPSAALVRFYQAQRAMLRAKLAAWHLEDHVTRSVRAKWLARAETYLHLAERYCSR